ncbi:hypothetical protein N9X93_03770 [Alphaproteobacteria bacterium]|nr:hypothetical protein [Alphaproteobacteria bacterium]
MFDKFDHKFKDNKHYNFFVVFAGLLFAAFLVLPEGWRRPMPLLLAVGIAGLIAKFAASQKQQDSD